MKLYKQKLTATTVQQTLNRNKDLLPLYREICDRGLGNADRDFYSIVNGIRWVGYIMATNDQIPFNNVFGKSIHVHDIELLSEFKFKWYGKKALHKLSELYNHNKIITLMGKNSNLESYYERIGFIMQSNGILYQQFNNNEYERN